MPLSARESQTGGDEQTQTIPARGAKESFVRFHCGRQQHRHLGVRPTLLHAQRDEHLRQPARVALALARRRDGSEECRVADLLAILA